MQLFHAHFGKSTPVDGLEMAADYSAKLNEIVKALDFIQLGGPSVTVLQTFEWVVSI